LRRQSHAVCFPQISFQSALSPCGEDKQSVIITRRLRGWDELLVLHSRAWFHLRLRLTGKEEFTQPLYEVVAAATGTVASHGRKG